MSKDDYKNNVLQATDIVDLIGSHLQLHPKGREFIGLCPFHDDHKPSMTVAPGKQLFKCFSCGAGGDALKFVQDYHKMSFPEALDFLGERYGVEKPANSYGSRDEKGSIRSRLRQVNENAAEYFKKSLGHPRMGEFARGYLKDRGLTQQTISEFGLGYAPDGWDNLLKYARNKRWDMKTLEEAGLIAARRQGDGHYDKLRHRLIFPIRDSIGRVIAFGGRKLREEDEPKYLNSPETALFDKSATLYGLDLAKKAIMNDPNHTVVITEGYTDVIACHQAGVKNVVATLGTALTEKHARELKRYCDRVVLLFDGDEAGQRAADRGLAVFFNEPIDVSIATLPGGMDPDELFALEDGKAQWENVMNNAVDALSFHFSRFKKKFDAADTISGKQRIIEAYLRSLVDLGFHHMEPMRRSLVIAHLSGILNLPIDQIGRMFDKMKPAKKAWRDTRQSPIPPVSPTSRQTTYGSPPQRGAANQRGNKEQQNPQAPQRPGNTQRHGSSQGHDQGHHQNQPNAPMDPTFYEDGYSPHMDEGFDPMMEVGFDPGFDVEPAQSDQATGNTPPHQPPPSSQPPVPPAMPGADAQDRPVGVRKAEEAMLGCLLNFFDFMELEMADGRPLWESVAVEDVGDSLLQILYGSLQDWYLDGHETMNTSEFRDVFSNGRLFDAAIDLKFKIDFDERDGREKAEQLLRRAVKAISDYNARVEYQMNKSMQAFEQTNQSGSQETAEDENKPDAEAEKLLRAMDFRRSHGATGRLGRVEDN